MGTDERKNVTLEDLRAIPCGGEKVFGVPSGRAIISARNMCNHLRRTGEIEEGYKFETSADYDNLTITIKKIKND